MKRFLVGLNIFTAILYSLIAGFNLAQGNALAATLWGGVAMIWIFVANSNADNQSLKSLDGEVQKNRKVPED